MEVYRLSREKFASPLSGKGAAFTGTRWNSIGVEMIYTASNRSLAMAEVVVHFTLATLPADYVMITIFVPDEVAILRVPATDLPPDWNTWPHAVSTRTIGDRFVAENKYALLQAPSAVTQGDYNLLINPGHSDFKHIKILETQKFPFDKRIFK